MPIFKKNKNEPALTGSMIVVAAGSGERMGGIDKIMAPLAGFPVIIHSLRACEEAYTVGEIIVVTREENIVPISRYIAYLGLQKVKKIIRGGETRVHSSLIGLKETSYTFCGIHDGARPCITSDLINSVMTAAFEYKAAIPGVTPENTLKGINENNFVSQTIDRNRIVAVQTPQCFETSLIRGALKAAAAGKDNITDDAQAAELAGIPIYIVQGESENIKLTVPIDMLIAEAVLNRRAF